MSGALFTVRVSGVASGTGGGAAVVSVVGATTERVGGELVAGALVVALLFSRLIWPGPGMEVEFVSSCARSRWVKEKTHPSARVIKRHDFPPYKDVKKIIS
jgi:hypothetical protein